MGMVTPEHLYHILWAANTYSHNPDPSPEINSYLGVNRQWTRNVREDSGQPDAWRDYQQILSEMGLIYSLEVLPQITLTPIGLALLDGSMGFSEVMTLQALRLQYPNGHHLVINPAERTLLAGTEYVPVNTLVELQVFAGVRVRPAVLVWRVLRALTERGEAAELSVDDLECYLSRCSVNADFEACATAIISARRGGIAYPRLGQRERRNFQEWMKLLRLTSIFWLSGGRRPTLTLSGFACNHVEEIDGLCRSLEEPASFWNAGNGGPADRMRWYSDLGGVDLSIPELPAAEGVDFDEAREYVGKKEPEEDRQEFEGSLTGGRIDLHEFQGLQEGGGSRGEVNIHSVYSAELSKSAHRLHDQMVLLIAQTCLARGARIYEDKRSVDLLIEHQQREFIVEVKSVTARNFVARMRLALGQVLHYDYLRSSHTQLPRRKVIAFAAQIPSTSWSIPFLNNFVGTDLLTLESGILRMHSPEQSSIQLFG